MTSVSVGLWVGVGSRYERGELNGVCHFIEHLLFKGTRKRSARQISEAVEGIGGYLNAFTSEDATCFHARACANRFDAVLDVLLDMLLNSRLAAEDITKEREVIKEEIAMYLDEPQHHVQELLNGMLWPRQPLGRPITGTNRSLDGLKRPDILRYFHANYVTGSTVLVVSGNISHRQVIQALRPHVSRFTPGLRPTFSPVVVNGEAGRVNLLTRKIEQTQLALGVRTCSRHDDRRFALRLLNTILGENMSSRLFQVLREDLGLVYSIYSSPSFFADTGDLVISAGVDTEKLQKTLQLIRKELKQLCEKLPGAAELRRARDYVIGQVELGKESTESQMNWVGEQLLGYGRVFAPGAVERRLARVTAAEIRAVARDFLQPERCHLALVSPLKSDTAIRKQFFGRA